MSVAFELSLTLFGHPHFEALLEAAVLTAVPRHLVDDAVLVAVTRVDHVLLDASAEEPLWTQNRTGLSPSRQEVTWTLEAPCWDTSGYGRETPAPIQVTQKTLRSLKLNISELQKFHGSV